MFFTSLFFILPLRSLCLIWNKLFFYHLRKFNPESQWYVFIDTIKFAIIKKKKKLIKSFLFLHFTIQQTDTSFWGAVLSSTTPTQQQVSPSSPASGPLSHLGLCRYNRGPEDTAASTHSLLSGFQAAAVLNSRLCTCWKQGTASRLTESLPGCGQDPAKPIRETGQEG